MNTEYRMRGDKVTVQEIRCSFNSFSISLNQPTAIKRFVQNHKILSYRRICLHFLKKTYKGKLH